MERQRTAVPRRSKLLNLARSLFLYRLNPVFALVPTPFLPLSKPILDPFLNPFLPLSTPALVPFLYCLTIISRCTLVAAQLLDHVGSPPVRRLVGGLDSWRGDARDQFARYVCSHTWEQAERRRQKGEGVGCAHCKEEEKTQRAGRQGGGGAERARPHRNCQQYQNDHRDSKNRRHEVEGSMKCDKQGYQWYRR